MEHYDAFISYSHAADRTVAPRLQHALEVFASGWFRARSLEVFRDATDLAANPGLWPRLAQVLDASDFFVLLASPQAAQSEWVDREVEHWLANRPASSILIAITAGDIAWDAASNDFDWSRTDCLPRRLAGRFADMPTAADFRGIANWDLGDPAFTEQAAKLAAPIHGRTMRELYDPEMRRYRRRLRIIGATAALLATLLVVVTWQLLRIRAQSREALAELLVNRARIEQPLAPARAALLAATADALRESPHSHAQWTAAAHDLAEWTGVLPAGALRALGDGGRTLLLVDDSGTEQTVATGIEGDSTDAPARPNQLRALGPGECILEDYVPVAPQGGDVATCVQSEIGFELQGDAGTQEIWVTVDGRVEAASSVVACEQAVLLSTDLLGVRRAATVDAAFVRQHGHEVRRTFDDTFEEFDDAAPVTGWARLGGVERPTTTADCAMLHLDPARQLRRWHPVSGESVVSDASFGQVEDFVVSSDGQWVAVQQADRTFSVRRVAGGPGHDAWGSVQWAAPVRAGDGSYVGVAVLTRVDGERWLCVVDAAAMRVEACPGPARPAPAILGGTAEEMPWDVSRTGSVERIIVADFPGVVICRPESGSLACDPPIAIVRAATTAAAIAGGGARIAVAQGVEVGVYDVSGDARPQIAGFSPSAGQLAFDGPALWLGGADGLRLWQGGGEPAVIDDRPVAHLVVPAGGGRAVVENGAGQLRLASTDGTVVDIGTLTRPATVMAAAAHEPIVAIGQDNGDLLFWDVERRIEAGRLSLGAAVTSAEFRSDDRELWVGAGGALTVVAADRSDLLRRTCAGIRLSDEGWLRLVDQVPPIDPCASAGSATRPPVSR